MAEDDELAQVKRSGVRKDLQVRKTSDDLEKQIRSSFENPAPGASFSYYLWLVRS
jgi:hypothetical protein